VTATYPAAPVAALQTGRAARQRRARTVTIVLAIAVVAAFALALFWGPEPLAPSAVLAALLGDGTQQATFNVIDIRLPRALTAVLAGAAFGLSGGILQLLARNPLASPDLVGISAGASAAAVFSLLVLRWGGLQVSFAALVGATTAATLIYLLAWRGGLQGYRFVLVGIGVAAMANAVISYLVARSNVLEAQYVVSWLVGSLNGRVWAQAGPLALAMILILPLAALAHRPLRALHLGDEIATGVGVHPDRAKLGLLVVAVLAAAVGTAAAGPLAFVALVSAPVARALMPGGRPALIASMLVGALLVVLSDMVASHIVPSVSLPAGVVTGAVGAPYLLWLLVRTNRTGRA
jgi:iron complex transport system permease protein